MRECRCHTNIGDKELDNPSSGVERKALLIQKVLVNDEVRVENAKLVVNSAVLVEKFL